MVEEVKKYSDTFLKKKKLQYQSVKTNRSFLSIQNVYLKVFKVYLSVTGSTTQCVKLFILTESLLYKLKRHKTKVFIRLEGKKNYLYFIRCKILVSKKLTHGGNFINGFLDSIC